MLQLPMWKCVALWINLDPQYIAAIPAAPFLLDDKRLVFPEAPPEFHLRLEIAVNRMSEIGFTLYPGPESQVILRDFAAWAIKLLPSFSMPDELKLFASEADARVATQMPPENEQRSSPVVDKIDPKLIDIEQAYDEIHANTGKAPSRGQVARRTGYNWRTVDARWPKLMRIKLHKTT
jgi:hypothetical protein